MRRLLPVLSITATAVLLMLALSPACGDQCNRAEDCATGEVCYAGVCEPLSQEYVRCSSEFDCDPNMAFECRAGRCTLKGTPPPVMMPDGGDASTDPEAGPGPDGGDAMPGMDAMNMDATSTVAPDGGGAGPDGGPADGGPVDSGMITSLDRIDANLDGQPVAWTMMANALIQATFTLASNQTFIQGTGNTGSPIEGRRIELSFPGATPGTYTCDTQGVQLEWEDATGTVFAAGMGIAGSSCTLTVMSYGAPGEAILGSFSGTLTAITIGAPPPANMNPPIMGTFDVQRDPDIP